MKQHIRTLLISSAVGGALALLAAFLLPALSWDGLNSPLIRWGDFLRELSLGGFWGNLGAWAGVLVISALPLLLLRKAGGWERSFPGLAALVLLLGQYFAVNPSYLKTPLREAFPLMALQTALSLVAAWWVLGWLRALQEREQSRLTGTFRKLFTLCAVLLAGSNVFAAVTAAVQNWKDASAASGALWLTFGVLVLLTVLQLVPELLAGLTLLLGGELAAAMEEGFDTVSEELCRRVADTCAMVAKVSVTVAAAGNLFQLALFNALWSSHFTLDIPLFTLALSAGLMLLCRILTRGRELQEDSDSII